MTDILFGVELYLSLDPMDQRLVDMFISCEFLAGITLPSGKALTSEQMGSIQRNR